MRKEVTITENRLIGIIRDVINEMNLYHASSSDFSKFNHKKYLSSGAGSQTFGWGTYLTDSYAIAVSYAEKFIWYTFNLYVCKVDPANYIDSSKYDADIVEEVVKQFKRLVRTTVTFNDPSSRFDRDSFDGLMQFNNNPGARYDDMLKQYNWTLQTTKKYMEETLKTEFNINDFNEKYNFNREVIDMTRDQYVAKAERMNTVYGLLKQVINAVWDDADAHVRKSSYLYMVEVPDDNGSNYIDLDQEVSRPIVDKVTEGLQRLSSRYRGNDWLLSKWELFVRNRGNYLYGQSLVDCVNNLLTPLVSEKGIEKAVSLFLSQCGFIGFKYRAGRIYGLPDGAAENSMNYVIFDANNVRITSKNIFSV